MDGNTSIVPRTGWKRIQEQQLCGSPEEFMGPAPLTIEDIELTDSEDEDRENKGPKASGGKTGRRKVQVAPSTTKKRGTTKAARGTSQKASTSRKVKAVKKAVPSTQSRVVKKAGPSSPEV